MLTYIGESRALSVTASRGAGSLMTPFAWDVRGDDAIHVTQSGQVVARAPGTAWIIVVSDSGGRDSTKVVVTQRVTRIEISPSAFSLPLPRTWRFQAVAYDAGGTQIRQPMIAWSSTSTSVATVAADGVVTAQSVGSTGIRATMDGVTSEAAALQVTPRARLRIRPDTIVVGAGHRLSGIPHAAADVTVDSLYPNEYDYAQAVVADATIATVSDVFFVPRHSGSPFVVAGLRTGTTTVTVSSARFSNDTAVIRVSTPRFSFTQFEPTKTMKLGVGQTILAFAYLQDSLGNGGRLLAPLTVTATSSDPSVARVVPTRVAETDREFVYVDIEALNPGSTDIVVSAPGYRSDGMLITVAPAGLSFVYSTDRPLDVTTVGVGQRTWIAPLVSRNTPVSTGPLTVTLSQRHPETLQLPVTTISLPLGVRSEQFAFAGLAKGADTIIATASGHAPDTLIVHVTTPTFRVSEITPSGTAARRAIVGILAADSTGLYHGQITAVTARIASSNPAVVRPVSDVITVGGMPLELEFLAAGTATLTFSDPSGLYLPTTSVLITVTSAEIVVEGPTETSKEYSLGMRQTLGATKPRVLVIPFVDKPVEVRLRSTNPSVVHPARATVQMMEYDNLYVDLIGGDVAGRAWIIAERAGMTSDSVAVVVSQPVLSVRGVSDIVTDARFPIQVKDGREFAVVVETRDSRGDLHRTVEPLTIQLSLSSAAHLALETTRVVIPAGASSSAPIPVRAMRTGTAVIRAIDQRTVSYRYETGAAIVTITSSPAP